jgi:DNA-directed RNA polymerase specialized sigma24 family protein
MMRLADEELLRLARRHPEAMGVFWQRFERPTLAFFRRRVADAQTALDLTSETFAQAALECGNGARVHDAASWLFAIAKSRLAAHQRVATVARQEPCPLACDELGAREDDLALLAVASVLRNSPLACRNAELRP